MKLHINHNVVETVKTVLIAVLITAAVSFIGGYNVGTKNADDKYLSARDASAQTAAEVTTAKVSASDTAKLSK